MGTKQASKGPASRLWIAAVAAAVALALPDRASGFVCLWDGSSSTAWTAAANWSNCNGTTPQSSDTVTINSGGNQPTLSGSATVGQITTGAGAALTIASGGALTLSNGFTGGGNLTVQNGGTLNWNSGTIDGAGTFTIQSGGILNLISSYGTLQRPLSNAGTMNISGGGYLYMLAGGTFANTGSVNLQGGSYCFYGSGAANTVTNSAGGTFTRNTGSGTATIYNVGFTNSGTFNVQTGTVDLSATGSVTHTGDFNVSAASTLQFSSSATNTISGDITGAGTVIFANTTNNLTGAHTIANTTITSGTVNFNQGGTLTLPNLTLSSGTIAGTSAITLSGTADLNSGTLAGATNFTVPAGMTVTLDSSYLTVQRPFVNAGTLVFLGNTYLYLLTGGGFTNQATGIVDIQHNTYALYGGATNTVTNNGDIKRTTSSGTAQIYNVAFINGSGASVSVESGTLDLYTTGSSTHAGPFDVAAGATLQFSGSATHTFNGTIGGAGNVIFAGGTQNLNGAYNIANTTIGGSTVNFNQGGGQSLANLVINSGTVAGSAAMTITGTLDANSGTLAGNANFTIPNGATATLDSSYLTISRPFRNAGSILLTNNAYLYFTGGSFTNQATGDVEIQHNTYGLYGSANQTASNAGTIRRTTGAGVASIYGLNLTNTGTVSIQSGTLQIYQTTYTQTAGATHLAGGNLEVIGTLSIQGGVLDGNGSINGNVSVSGSGQFNPGSSPGEIAITNSHSYTQAAAGVLNAEIDGPDPGFDYDRVLINGAASLGGTLNVSLGFTPAVGQSFTILEHTSRTGSFGTLTGDSPGAGRGWDISYSATETKLTVAQMLGALMNVDIRSAAGTTSDANQVLEPGERVVVEPSWVNITESPITLAGTASNFTGPAAAGVSYTLSDTSADYGSSNAGATSNCFDATGNCFQVQVTNPTSHPDARPATHWDATFQEAGTGGTTKTWTLHVGDSFTDVPRSQLFYRRIETLLHTGITAGCTPTTYCPSQPVNRGQMAIFVARGLAGGSANVPVSGNITGFPYNCVAGPTGASAFADVLPTDIYCRHVHYIAAQNVTLGCGSNPLRYCPSGNISRLEMASFIAKAVVAPGGGTAVPLAYGPDPVTTFSYNCNGASIHFTDVPASNVFCKHVHFLWARGIISGISPTQFGPALVVTRDGMARFLSNAFNLLLYGPVP